MRNSKGAFGRIDGEYDYFVGETTCPTWLDSFARKLASEPEAPKTAVEAARERNENVYQQMSAIMNKNGPKFSSVEEVVADYRKRTGMEVQAKNKLASIASSIVKAADEDEELGMLDGWVLVYNTKIQGDLDGRQIRTSEIVDYDPASGVISTKNGSKYVLGNMNDSIMASAYGIKNKDDFDKFMSIPLEERRNMKRDDIIEMMKPEKGGFFEGIMDFFGKRASSKKKVLMM